VSEPTEARQDSVSEISPPRPVVSRKPWVAGLLALLFGTVAQVYCGRLRRAICWGLLYGIVFIVIVCLMLYLPYGRAAMILSAILYCAFWIAVLIDAVRIAHVGQIARRFYQRWWCYVIYYAVAIVAGCAMAYTERCFCSEAFVIPTASMANTLLPGDRFLVEKLIFRHTPICRGDVIAYRASDEMIGPRYRGTYPPEQHPNYVKRVMGIPGDVVEIRDEVVFVNGQRLDEPYANLSGDLPAANVAPQLTNLPPRTVPEDSYFVLGDHRRASYDSRMGGFVHKSDIIGKVGLIYWSRETPTSPEVPSRTGSPDDTPAAGRIRWERLGLRID
jgi:signal peptidase I